ncbi:MAG: hypothetical protein RBU37_22860 [Myxococcota bacterium]|nr:hypothetical protein [Myxococcota bacterium]
MNALRPLVAYVPALIASLLLLLSPELLAQCAICEPCITASDCGSGYSCIDFGGGGRCSMDCDGQTCAGDSRCFDVQGSTGTRKLCLNPGAATSLCPSSYVCSSQRSCEGLGELCGPSCSDDAELCLNGDSYEFCSCYCRSNADCSGGSCITNASGRQVCWPAEQAPLCDGVTCPSGHLCNPSTGFCYNPSSSCPGMGDDCRSGLQACPSSQNDICLTDGVHYLCSCACLSDSDCAPDGECVSIGNGKLACIQGNPDLCAGVNCPSGQVCSPATGTCIGDTPPEPRPEQPEEVVERPDPIEPIPDQSPPDETELIDAPIVIEGQSCGCKLSQQSATPWQLYLLLPLGYLGVRRTRVRRKRRSS